MIDWSDDRVAMLRRMFAAGCTDAEMALAMGISLRSVIGKRQRIGLKRNAGGGRDAYDAAIRRAEKERAASS